MNDLTFLIKICTNAVNILLACEIGIYLFANRRTRHKELIRSQNQPPTTVKINIGFFLFFLMNAIGFLFNVLELYSWYNTSDSRIPSSIFANLKIFFSFYAISSLFLIICSILLPVKYKNSIWVIFLGILGLIGFSFLPNASLWIFTILAYLIIPLCIIPLLMLYQFISITNGNLRRQFCSIFIGFLFFLMGSVFITNVLAPIIHFRENYTSELLILTGLLLMGFGFIKVPSFNEAFAAAFLEEVYVTNSDGTIILRYRYQTATDALVDATEAQLEEEFIGSSIVGIDGLLREISSAPGMLKTLVHQKKILIVEWIPPIFGVFITRIDLHSLRSQLSTLLKMFETPALNEIPGKLSIPESTQTTLHAKAAEWYNLSLNKYRNKAKLLFPAFQKEIFL